MSSGSAPAKQTGLPVGTVVGGRFEIEKRIAAGGMGVVYRAIQQPLGRSVALKVLRRPQDPRLDESHSQRFLQEAAAVARLSHPNTVVVHDYGRDGELLYFAMEFIGGRTLSDRIRKEGPFSPDETVHVAKQMASSLKNAHGCDLVHRDLKPGNIMLLERGDDPLFTKVLDFGLVKLLSNEEDKKLTQSGILMGSPRYMAPEQVKGGTIDERADIYSFGGLLCFMLTGKPPFAAGSQFEAMRAHVYTPAPRIRELAPDCNVSEEFEEIVAKCLAKEPEERFQSMEALLHALSTLTSESRTSSVDVASTPPASEAPSESTISSMTSFVTQAIIDPGTSGLAWTIRIVAALAVVGLGAGLAVLLADPSTEAHVVAEPLPAPEEEPEPVVEDPDPEPAIPAGSGAPEEVALRANVAGAQFFVGDVLLGTGTATVAVPEGEAVTVRAEAMGYEPSSEQIRGDVPTVRFALRRAAAEEEEEQVRRPPSRMRRRTPMVEMEAEPAAAPTPRMQHRTIHDPWNQ